MYIYVDSGEVYIKMYEPANTINSVVCYRETILFTYNDHIYIYISCVFLKLQ